MISDTSTDSRRLRRRECVYNLLLLLYPLLTLDLFCLIHVPRFLIYCGMERQEFTFADFESHYLFGVVTLSQLDANYREPHIHTSYP